MLYVAGYRDINNIPCGNTIINTTSNSSQWKRLSPFYLACGHLYGEYNSFNVENAWQFSKVYSEYVDDDGNIFEKEYFDWAEGGWASTYPNRYPMGKDRLPLFHLWDGERLGTVEARKRIYIPLYERAVRSTPEFTRLTIEARNPHRNVYLLDYDGYNHIELGMSIEDVINCKDRKMGHSFVLYKMIMEGV